MDRVTVAGTPDPLAKAPEDRRSDGDPPEGAHLVCVRRRAIRRVAHLLGPRAAELGCGSGRLTGLVAEEGLAVALDGSPERLASARRRLGEAAPLVHGDLVRLPVQSGSLTGALMPFVSPPLDADAARRAFAEVARVLQPGGHLLLLLLQPPATREVEDLLRGAGLEVLARRAVRRSPSRLARWVRTGRLPRALWSAGTILDAGTTARRLADVERVETLVVARKPGPAGVPLPDARENLRSMFLPRAWSWRRDARRGPQESRA